MRVKMMSGDILNITPDEVKNIQGKSGLVFVPSLQGLINLSSVESILPDGLIAEKEGYLHDGIRVIKKFGAWVVADDQNIKIDPHFYPEVAKDQVFRENPKVTKLLNS